MKYRKSDMEEKVIKATGDMIAGKKRHYPPTVRLDENDLKEVKTWDVGKTYKVEMSIKMTEKRQGQGDMVPFDDDGANKVHGLFEVISVEAEN